MYGLDGKVVVVTGGNVGLGRAMAARFLREGCKVLTCSRRDYDKAPALDGVPGAVDRIVHMTCDVREPDQAQAVIDRAVSEFGRLDVLVNNAGGSPGAAAATASPRFFDAVIRTNLTSVFVFSQKANAVMQGQETGGVIVNISSVAGIHSSPVLSAYGAAKAGVINATRSLAIEWGPKVRMNCIAPGLILTEGAEYLAPTPEAKAAFAASVPAKRIGVPEDIADVAAWLASDQSSYVVGETIVVDGGGRISSRPV